jgi:hypothetical protein
VFEFCVNCNGYVDTEGYTTLKQDQGAHGRRFIWDGRRTHSTAGIIRFDAMIGGNMDPVTGLGLFNSIAGAARSIAGIATAATNHETKVQLNEVYDTLIGLKQAAADLEGENRALKEQLRFKSDDFEFRTPFYYEKAKPTQPLCAPCFAKQIIAPMGEVERMGSYDGRRCVVCHNGVALSERPSKPLRDPPGPWS